MHGLSRVARSYGLTLLAAALGLPVLAAGLITTNSCTLRGGDCTSRLVYAVIGAIALAGLVQLVLLVHSGLGWLCWAGVAAVTATAALHPTEPLVVLMTASAGPGLGAWISEPERPGRRHRVHRLLRFWVVAAVVAGSSVWALAEAG